MSTLTIADQTFLVASGEIVAARIADSGAWRQWWPDLRLTVTEDRGVKGIRWTVDGAVIGTMEIWLEPVLDGVMFHYFLHGEPNPPIVGPAVPGELRRRRVAGKDVAFALKGDLERGREAGEPPTSSAVGSAHGR